MADRDTGDDASLDGLRGNLLRGPVCHWVSAVGRFFAGKSDDLCHLLRAESSRSSTAVLIRQTLSNKASQILLRGTLRFRFGQTGLQSDPSVSPPTSSLVRHTELSPNLDIAQPSRRQQDDLYSRQSLLRRLMSIRPSIQSVSLSRRKLYHKRMSGHSQSFSLTSNHPYDLILQSWQLFLSALPPGTSSSPRLGTPPPSLLEFALGNHLIAATVLGRVHRQVRSA